MVCSMKKYCFHDFFSISKKWSFLDIFCKMLRMSQGIAKSHVSVYRWNQRRISFKLSPNNRISGDHWKNVITGTLLITIVFIPCLKLKPIFQNGPAYRLNYILKPHLLFLNLSPGFLFFHKNPRHPVELLGPLYDAVLRGIVRLIY